MKVPELKRILYVEDDPDIKDVVSISLEDIGGYELNICDSAEEALKAAPEFKPDLFLLDVMMPDISGPQLVELLREDPEYKLTPIIFITAKAQLNELMDYSRLGVLGIIRKPFDPLSISTSIYDLWKNFHENPSSGRM